MNNCIFTVSTFCSVKENKLYLKEYSPVCRVVRMAGLGRNPKNPTLSQLHHFEVNKVWALPITFYLLLFGRSMSDLRPDSRPDTDFWQRGQTARVRRTGRHRKDSLELRYGSYWWLQRWVVLGQKSVFSWVKWSNYKSRPSNYRTCIRMSASPPRSSQIIPY